MAEQPGVQGLHAAEVRNLDEFRMPRLRVHKATPQDQGTTVLARPETIALLHYPGRRRQTEGEPPTISRKRLASRHERAARFGVLDAVGSRFVRNVSMVGVSGSGKSTLGRELAARLAVPYAELDAVFHQPEWTPLPEEDFRRRVSSIASGNGWVIDGNYSAVLPLVWEHADTVVWLDPPRRTVMRRIIWRSVCRVARRTELWNGNRERWRNLLTWDEQESVISWAWHHYPIYRQRYAAAARDPRFTHLTFHRIATRADANHLLASAG